MSRPRTIQLTEEQERRARALRPTHSLNAIARELGMVRSTFQRAVRDLDPPLPEQTKDFSPIPKERGNTAEFKRWWADETKTIEDIEKHFGYAGHGSSARRAKRLGLPPRTDQRKPWTPEDDKKLREAWARGYNVRDIGRLLNVSPHAVSRRARVLGLKRRAQGSKSRAVAFPVIKGLVLDALRERGPLMAFQLRDLVFMPNRVPLEKMSSLLQRMRHSGDIACSGMGQNTTWRIVPEASQEAGDARS